MTDTAVTAFSTTLTHPATVKFINLWRMLFFVNKSGCGIAAIFQPMNFNDIDLICLSHLRWGFVFQRPQHLMSRFGRSRRVFFFEEPVFEENAEPRIKAQLCPQTGVHVCAPVLPCGLDQAQINSLQRDLLNSLLDENDIRNYIAWYYTPTAMEFTSALDPKLTAYDCMDELSAFSGAPLSMRNNEQALFRQAQLVFTGGKSLFDSKRKQHESVYLFPSSVDTSHFGRARQIQEEPADQKPIRKPRFGFAGVIDERMNIELLRQIAQQRPDWQFVLLGPVVKIDAASLPKAPNIHFLGMKSYADLPAYLAGWNIGMLPFALNESTRFISPTKTPEYLAAGLRVISTPIRDVVTPYGQLGFVSIAENAEQFVEAGERLLAEGSTPEFQERADQFLAQSSWDKTAREMEQLIESRLVLGNSLDAHRTAMSVDLLAEGVQNV
jgi:glycosyltransferase involved in cell wall biosynthesis